MKEYLLESMNQTEKAINGLFTMAISGCIGDFARKNEVVILAVLCFSGSS